MLVDFSMLRGRNERSLQLTLGSPTLWGNYYARHHIVVLGEALKNRVINMDDSALLLSTTVDYKNDDGSSGKKSR
jgi:hypothetical protein